jgi:hypothetical protein
VSSYPYLDAGEFISAEFGDDITQTILPTMRSLLSHPYFREFHIDIIGDHEDI